MRTFALTAVLLSLAGLTRADDCDPEPPGSSAAVRKLQGKWVSVRQLVGGKEKAFEGTFVYTFDGDKASYSSGSGRQPIALTFEADRKRPNVFRLFRVNGKDKAVNKYFFKVEKGELYLTLDRSGKPDTKADFSGKVMPVTVYKRQ